MQRVFVQNRNNVVHQSGVSFIRFVVIVFFACLRAWGQVTLPFTDDFNESALNPAWQVLQGQGSYSLGGGQLTYYNVGPVASTTGWYNPALTLALPFTGTNWKLEIKATYSLDWCTFGNTYTGPPVPNYTCTSGAQGPQVAVSFSPGAIGNNYAGSDYALIERNIDAYYGSNTLSAYYEAVSNTNLLNTADTAIQNNIADGTYWYQIIRNSGTLTINVSYDGVNYNTAFSTPLANPSGTYNELLLGGITYSTAGSYTDYSYVHITGTCPVNPADVRLNPGPPNSFDGHPTRMNATFVPGVSSGNPVGLAAAADACGFIGFNWQQSITVWPLPSMLCTPDTCLSAVALPGFYLSAPPPLSDPYPNGGWVYELANGYPNGDFSYPFYYDQNTEIALHETPPGLFPITLSFRDNPADPDLLNSELQYGPEIMQFTTSLVGVMQGNQLGPALFSWTWATDFDGTVGGLLATKTDLPVDLSSGTGGVTITSINGVQLPPVVSPNQIATTASGLAYSRVSQTFNGTVTIMNVSSGVIDGPLQVVFFGLPANVTLVNATSSLSGTPYVTASAVASLAPGQSVTFSVELKNPSNTTINLTPVVYSGSIN